MSYVYLITPKKSNSFVKEEVYKKGKQIFSIISTWKKCVLITEQPSKTRHVDGVIVTDFKNFTFKENQHDYKEKLILPEGLSDGDKKTIRKIFKDGNLWMLSDEGWSSHETIQRITGELVSEYVPVHKITLCTSEVELVYKPLTKAEFDDYSANGMPQSEYEDSVDHTGKMFDELTMLSIDDVDLLDFEKQFKIKYEEAVKTANFGANRTIQPKEVQFAVIGESWTKRSWYDLTIYEDFDFSKIEVHVSRDFVFGKGTCYETFSITYDGIELEFRENLGPNVTDYCLIDSNGNQTGLNLIDEDEDEDEDEED